MNTCKVNELDMQHFAKLFRIELEKNTDYDAVLSTFARKHDMTAKEIDRVIELAPYNAS